MIALHGGMQRMLEAHQHHWWPLSLADTSHRDIRTSPLLFGPLWRFCYKQEDHTVSWQTDWYFSGIKPWRQKAVHRIWRKGRWLHEKDKASWTYIRNSWAWGDDAELSVFLRAGWEQILVSQCKHLKAAAVWGPQVSFWQAFHRRKKTGACGFLSWSFVLQLSTWLPACDGFVIRLCAKI